MLLVTSSGEISLTRGDTARLTVSVTNDNDEPYVIQAGDTLTLSVKRSIKDTEFAFQKKIIGGDTFYIEPEDTDSLDFGKYKYDVEITTENGEVYTVIPPTVFKILEEVT